MARITFTRGTLAAIGAAAAVLAAGGGAIASAGDDAAPPVSAATAASVSGATTTTSPAAGKPANLRLTTGSYAVDILEWDSAGKQGLGTVVDPHTVQELHSYDLPGYDITDEQFFLATENGAAPPKPGQSHGRLITSVPQPTDGHVLDCAATGTATTPAIHCTTT